MPLSIVIAAAIAASAPAADRAHGPTASNLAEALSAWPPVSRVEPDQLRAIVCQSVEEEPTEFPCTYERKAPGGGWSKWNTVIAIEGRHWIVIDEPAQVLARRR